MKDGRLFPLRLKAEKDRRLANAGMIILMNIISKVNNSRLTADDEFPLPWTLVEEWTGLEEDQCYRWIRRLELFGYLKIGNLCGSPPRRFFQLIFDSRKKAGIDSRKKAGIDSRTEAGHLISNSLREENIIEGGSPLEVTTPSAGKDLTAPSAKRGTLSASPVPKGAPAFDVKSHLKAFREAQGRREPA